MGYHEGHTITDPDFTLLLQRFVRDRGDLASGYNINLLLDAALQEEVGAGLRIQLLSSERSVMVLIEGDPTHRDVSSGVSQAPLSHLPQLLNEFIEIKQDLGADSDWHITLAQEEGAMSQLEHSVRESESRKLKEFYLHHSGD